MTIAARALAILRGKYTIGASARVGRNFIICDLCRRVVPAWQLVIAKPKRGQVIGCRCGSVKVRPAIVPWWVSSWWFFVVGLFWRRLVCWRREWDPRLAMRL
jgi:hypothetical protein